MIKKEYDIFVFLFLVDGATISIVPILNIFPVAVLELVDCQGHISDGWEKDGTFIWTIFLEHTQN